MNEIPNLFGYLDKKLYFCTTKRRLMKQTLTLYELNSLVRTTIELTLPNAYWVEAELSEVRVVRGHCYMELVQRSSDKNARGGRGSGQQNTPIARAQARCWQTTWSIIGPHFERVTGQPLRAGLKVLLQVYAQFHEAYGFSWIVSDIDPTFTLGDMARKRQEIINQLKEEGVFDLNKQLPLPLFAQRIAVISAANAAGYGDFVDQLRNNEYGFCFSVELFPAIMQGEQVESSVISALNAIAASESAQPSPLNYDCVVIIRGGGAVADMSGFDTLLLAENVANFPLPIITGIGHERDECILDMVSHTRVKTPTAAAAFLINNLKTTSERILRAQEEVLRIVSRRMEHEKVRLATLSERIPALFSVVRSRQERRIDQLQNRLLVALQHHLSQRENHLQLLTSRLPLLTSQKLMREQHRLELLNQRIRAVDPQLLLSRGYSVTLLNGRALRNADQLKVGDELITRLAIGQVKSTATDILKSGNE